MLILKLVLSTLAYVTVMLLNGHFSKNYIKTTRDQFVYQIGKSLLSLLMLALIFRAFRPHGFTLLLSGAMGVASLVSSIFTVICYRYGPVGISSMIMNCIMLVISSSVGPIFWKESVSALQLIGIVLSLLSIYLITEKSLMEKVSFKWLLCILLAGIGGGVQGPIQKVLTSSPYAGENLEFVIYSFVFSTAASFLTIGIFCGDFRRKKQPSAAEESEAIAKQENPDVLTYGFSRKILVLFLVVAALAVFLNVNNLELVKELPTVIFFPVYTVGGLLLTNIATSLLFHEKMTPRQLIGFGVGLVSLLLISGTMDSLL